MSIANETERDTIIAALRYWQADRLAEHPLADRSEIVAIATNNGKHGLFPAVDIDALCERLNHEYQPASEEEVAAARAEWGSDDLEIDEPCQISPIEDPPGYWIQAWVFMSTGDEA